MPAAVPLEVRAGIFDLKEQQDMQTAKPIELHGQPASGGKFPLICIPLVGRGFAALMAELDVVLPKKPDMLEWRVDFFQPIGDTTAVMAAASAIKAKAGPIPVLFTRRSRTEGGEKIDLDEDQVIALYAAVCESRSIDLIDYEMVNDVAHITQMRQVAQANGIKLVLSFHDFSCTPGLETLVARFLLAEQLGADVAKVAVMPRDLDDVLTLLAATREASKKLRSPLISMSMGPYGSVTRLIGWV
ncbi:MAG: type I 3-dehydroquinate dehydratase, partial [Rhodoferax sp.]